jgi:5-methylcytosine-specific restriction endonuclease McrA
MLYPTRSGGGGVGMFWMAQCDCGAMKEIRASEAKKGYIKTCGKCEHYLTLLKNAAKKGSENRDPQRPVREAYVRYVYGAVSRGIEWKLSPEQFEEIIAKNCTYCQSPPREHFRKDRKGKGRGHKLIRNGIDRINNRVGYTFDNVTTCCSTCNRMKHTMDIIDFAKHVVKMSEVLKKVLPNEEA